MISSIKIGFLNHSCFLSAVLEGDPSDDKRSYLNAEFPANKATTTIEYEYEDDSDLEDEFISQDGSVVPEDVREQATVTVDVRDNASHIDAEASSSESSESDVEHPSGEIPHEGTGNYEGDQKSTPPAIPLPQVSSSTEVVPLTPGNQNSYILVVPDAALPT